MVRPRALLSLAVAFAMVVFTALTTVQGLWRTDEGMGWKQTIRSDARGYYGYLTALFIRNDLGNEPYAWEYVHRTPTGTLNKYFSGTAVLMAPWFAIGHDLALGDPKAPRDGYSRQEMKALAVGAWIYLLLGLLALRSLLLGLGVRDEVVAWLLFILVAGTTLLQYAAIQSGWSHIYSFFTISVLLWLVHRVDRGANLWWMVAAGALLGLIVLIRPVNALVLLGLPVVLGGRTLHLVRLLLRRWPALLATAAAAGAVVAIQPVLWYLQTGNWLEWGYRREGFYWGRAEVFNVLFSIRRGLFIWTPVFLAAALAVLLLWRRDRTRSLWALLYWTVNVLVISSWWIWYYGSGFGSRVFIEHYPVFLLPLALVLERASRRWWTLARLFFLLCVALHLLQFVQYHRGILHHERMDAHKYAYTFLKLDPKWAGMLGGKFEVPPFAPKGLDQVLLAATDLERRSEHWHHGWIKRHPAAYSGSMVCQYDSSQEFGVTFIARAGELPVDRELWLEVRLMRYEEEPGASLTAMAITAIHRPDGSFAFYDSFRLNHVPGRHARHWEALEHRIPVPALNAGEELRFYIWNQGLKAAFLLDDPVVRVWAVRPY
jgi:hypothetical protein